MDSNSFSLLLCFLLRPTCSINGNLIFSPASGRECRHQRLSGSCFIVLVFLPLRPSRSPPISSRFGLGFGHQEPSAAEEMRLRRFICFLWCFNEQSARVGFYRFFSGSGGSHYHGGESCSSSSQVAWSSISIPARVGDSLRLGLCPGSSYCLYTRRVLEARVFVCRFSTTSGFVAGTPLVLLEHLRPSSSHSFEGSLSASACLAWDSAAYQRTSLYGDDVVIVAAHRTALCKSKRGNFKDTFPDDHFASPNVAPSSDQESERHFLSTCWRSTMGFCSESVRFEGGGRNIRLGLNRTGKSCRLRWVNYLHPGLKRGKMTNR
ncbi:unnamed protein product [Brassica oleracea var. botrytis]|uniref:(rape) hypothetical protein n=1 Tax=Brassica napus TaxID=3708 RepID=A0A078F7W3_BRANA|nr:unnamed protein product [Brassica napus]CDY07823.1 BnaC03g47990D [Brassica napus]